MNKRPMSATRFRSRAAGCPTPGRRRFLVAGAAVALSFRGLVGPARSAASLADEVARVARAGGGVVEVAGSVGLPQTLRLPSNCELRGIGEARLYPEDSLQALVEIGQRARHVIVSGIEFDGAGDCDYLLRGEGVEDVAIERCSGVRWRNGFVLGSTADNPARDLRLDRVTLTRPASGAVYPVLVRSGLGGPLVDGLTATDIVVEGSGGTYSRRNAATADQVTLQGVTGFRLERIDSSRGGENGITVSRLSRDGILRGCVSHEADGHGFTIGSGYLAVDVDDASGFAARRSFGAEGGAEGDIQTISGRRLFLNRVVRGTLSPGEEIESGGFRATVRAVERTRNIALLDCVAGGNWQNRGSGPGTGAGFYVQQAEAVGLYCCVASNFGAGGQSFGLLAAQSRVGWRGCQFAGNDKAEVNLVGKSERLPVAPGSVLRDRAQELGIAETGCVSSGAPE